MKNILIVDDSATSRTLFKIYFPANSGYKVVEASNKDEALEQAASCDPVFVILDYNMPGATGIEVGHALRAKGCKCPFVVVTANTQQSVKDEAADLGVADVIEKPLTREKLEEFLGKLA